MPTIDEIAPRYVREKKLDLSLEPKADPPRAFNPILVQISYERTLPADVSLPLIFEVQGPSPSSYRRTDYTRHRPRQLIFTPREGGRHLVILREAFHNRHWGSLAIDVAGETLADTEGA